MSAGKGKVVEPNTVAYKLHEATRLVRSAQTELAKLRALYRPGDTAHAQCEQVDDCLHDALTMLGD